MTRCGKAGWWTLWADSTAFLSQDLCPFHVLFPVILPSLAECPPHLSIRKNDRHLDWPLVPAGVMPDMVTWRGLWSEKEMFEIEDGFAFLCIVTPTDVRICHHYVTPLLQPSVPLCVLPPCTDSLFSCPLPIYNYNGMQDMLNPSLDLYVT